MESTSAREACKALFRIVPAVAPGELAPRWTSNFENGHSLDADNLRPDPRHTVSRNGRGGHTVRCDRAQSGGRKALRERLGISADIEPDDGVLRLCLSAALHLRLRSRR